MRESREVEPDLDDVTAVIDAVGAGRLVVVMDDASRENEGDVIGAADRITPEQIAFMAREGRGLVCVALTVDRARALDLPPMVEQSTDPMGTAFTVSVDGTSEHGVTTGISATDRATTARLLASGTASDLSRPGHVFPVVARDGGLLERGGHTEAAVDLARLSGLTPVGVIVEIIGDDGQMLRGHDLVEFARSHDLPVTSVKSLRRHLRTLG